ARLQLGADRREGQNDLGPVGRLLELRNALGEATSTRHLHADTVRSVSICLCSAKPRMRTRPLDCLNWKRWYLPIWRHGSSLTPAVSVPIFVNVSADVSRPAVPSRPLPLCALR